jgi:hypothetical protein
MYNVNSQISLILVTFSNEENMSAVSLIESIDYSPACMPVAGPYRV